MINHAAHRAGDRRDLCHQRRQAALVTSTSWTSTSTTTTWPPPGPASRPYIETFGRDETRITENLDF